MKKSIKKNYIYNLIYQITTIIIPIIVTPYLSRILLAKGIGKYSFSYSLITYFTLFSSLGFGYYAQREMAKKQDDRLAQSKIFWEIIICRSIPVIFAICLNLLLACLGVYGEYKTLMLLLTINIVGVGTNISFYFQGNEDFKKMVIINTAIKIIGASSIFLFINEEDDVAVYAIIQSVTLLLSELLLWPQIICKLEKVKIKDLKPLIHFKGAIVLFIPTLATSVYTILDKTLIGVITGSNIQNGYYEQAEKIIKLAFTVITCLGTVMIPRNTHEYSIGNVEKVKQNIYNSFHFLWMLGTPLMVGIVVISENLVPWFLGNDFLYSIILLKVLSLLIFIIGASNIVGLQYLIPTKKDKKFTLALTLGAGVNLIFNIFLIYLFESLGAAISTIIAEFVISITMIIMVKKELSIKKIMEHMIKPFISAAIMYCVSCNINMEPSILNTIIIILISMVVYFSCMFILKDTFVIYAIKNVLYRKKSKT